MDGGGNTELTLIETAQVVHVSRYFESPANFRKTYHDADDLYATSSCGCMSLPTMLSAISTGEGAQPCIHVGTNEK